MDRKHGHLLTPIEGFTIEGEPGYTIEAPLIEKGMADRNGLATSGKKSMDERKTDDL